MKLSVQMEGNAKEIAALALELLQGRQETQAVVPVKTMISAFREAIRGVGEEARDS